MLAGDCRDLLREKARLERLVKDNKAQLERLERALIGMMGTFLHAEAVGLKVTRYLQNGAIDYARALKALLPAVTPETLEAYRRTSAERVRVTAFTPESATVPWDDPAMKAPDEPAPQASYFF